ncbi:glycosyltransferase family 2 protein [Thomasclavelia cocleata]|uniref:glycosyltransferase family 2 protein n=1 Tax=Thomasclavelia cocleata TaxID=69824 RepID=UPI0025A9B47D|nr:glycosyltransferase family 2 protein [Thomasclavelia cocleata]
MSKYDLSIVITTYNRKEFLLEAIKSIENQNFKNYEIIVIDDHSNDGTRELFKYQDEIKYLYCDNHNGPSVNRKKGLEIAQGEFIIFMDDDDFYTDNDFFENGIKILRNNQDIAFLSANANLYISEAKEIQKGTQLEFKGKIESIKYLELFQSKIVKPYSTFTTIFRKKLILNNGISEIKMFNDSSIYINVLYYSDYVFFMRDIIGCYRIHNSNISRRIEYSFIKDNIEEKINIYYKLKVTNTKFNNLTWFFEQLKVTCDYYVYGSFPSLSDVKELYKWLKNIDSDFDILELRKLFIRYCFTIIKEKFIYMLGDK